MADKPEMELGLASDCKWVRALDADGNSIRIEKSVLVELIRSEMPVATNGKGLADSNFFSSHKGSVHIESWGDLSGLNFTFSPGSYTVRTGDSSIWGHLIVFYTGNPALHGNIIQFLIRPSDDWFLKVRVSTSANLEITSEWKSFFLRDLYRRTKSLILVHIPRPKKVEDMESEDKRINQLPQISSAPANGVLPIDVPGSIPTNGITVDNLAKTMPVATSERNGMMGSSVLKSICSFASTIQPRSTFDTGIMGGGLILIQNTGMVHDIAVAIIYADGRGTIICAAPKVSFFHGSDYIDVRKEGANGSIQIVNNTDAVQHFAFRIICSII